MAEKLRTLLQRRRATDLSDLALILNEHGEHLNRARVKKLASVKFELVKQGDRRARLESNVEELRSEYGTIPGLDPGAASFEDAKELLMNSLSSLMP